MRDVSATPDHADASSTADRADDGTAPAGGTPRPVDAPPTGWQPSLTVQGGRSALGPALLGITTLLVALGALAALRLPGGTTVAGTPVADAGQADAALDAAAAALADLRLDLVTPVGTRTSATAAELGLQVERDATTAPIGRGLPSIGAWLSRLVDGPVEVPLVVVPPSATALGDLAAELSRDPVGPDVRVLPSGLDVADGADGIVVDAGAVDAALDAALARVATTDPAAWPAAVEGAARGEVTTPTITQADVDAVTAQIARVEQADVTLRASTPATGEGEESAATDDADGRGGDDRQVTAIQLTPRELRALVGVEADLDAPEGQRLQLVPAPATAPGRVVALLDLAAVQPTVTAQVVDATPTPDRDDDLTDVSDIGGRIEVEGTVPGFAPDRDATLAAVVEAALAGGGEVGVVGGESTTLDPAELGITEPISTFTTFYTPGQSRNVNIRRIAELVDGTIIPAGEAYELNHAVGRRTREAGFTDGGAILDGELVSDVGGGVSQFATTFFNAAWFAGVDLVDWKPHSFYFGRYPAGREATINYPNVNLEIRNDTPHAILVDTDADEDSVTVTFWSTEYWDVETISGPCACGGSFRITVDRIRTAPGGAPIQESWTTVYDVPR